MIKLDSSEKSYIEVCNNNLKKIVEAVDNLKNTYHPESDCIRDLMAVYDQTARRFEEVLDGEIPLLNEVKKHLGIL